MTLGDLRSQSRPLTGRLGFGKVRISAMIICCYAFQDIAQTISCSVQPISCIYYQSFFTCPLRVPKRHLTCHNSNGNLSMTITVAFFVLALLLLLLRFVVSRTHRLLYVCFACLSFDLWPWRLLSRIVSSQNALNIRKKTMAKIVKIIID